MQNRQAMQYVNMAGDQQTPPRIQGNVPQVSTLPMMTGQIDVGQPPRKNAVSSLGLKGKSPNELSMLGQRNGAITGLNLVSPTSNFVVGDLHGGAKSVMTQHQKGLANYGGGTSKNSQQIVNNYLGGDVSGEKMKNKANVNSIRERRNHSIAGYTSALGQSSQVANGQQQVQLEAALGTAGNMVGSPIVNTGNNIMAGPGKSKNLMLAKNGDMDSSFQRFGRNHNVATIGAPVGPATTSAMQAQANQLVFSPTAQLGVTGGNFNAQNG